MRRESARASNDQFGEIICPRASLKSPRGEARQITHDFPAIERENGNNAMQCNERIVGSRRLDAVSLKERVTNENNRMEKRIIHVKDKRAMTFHDFIVRR